MILRQVTGAAFALLAMSGPTFADDQLEAFKNAYRCPLMQLIGTAFDAAGRGDRQDRFVILTRVKPAYDYVQCAFDPGSAYCEAASYFYRTKTPRYHLSAKRIRMLAALGFSSDYSKGNFSLTMPVKGAEDLTRVADLMLTAIYQGYGARIDTPMETETPLLSKRHLPFLPADCPPVS